MNKKIAIGAIILIIVLAIGAGFWKWEEKNEQPYQEVIGQTVKEPDKPIKMSQEQIDVIVEKSKHVEKLGDIPEGVTEEEYDIAFKMKFHQLNISADGKNIPWRGNYGRNLGNKFFGKKPISEIPEGETYISILYFNGDDPSNYSDKKVQVKITSKIICVYPEKTSDPRTEFLCLEAGKGKNPKMGSTIQLYGSMENNIITASRIVIVDSGGLPPGSQFDNLQ